MKSNLITVLEVVEEKVGVGNGEDEVLHLLPQHVQVLPVLHIPGWRIDFLVLKCTGFLNTSFHLNLTFV